MRGRNAGTGRIHFSTTWLPQGPTIRAADTPWKSGPSRVASATKKRKQLRSAEGRRRRAEPAGDIGAPMLANRRSSPEFSKNYRDKKPRQIGHAADFHSRPVRRCDI